MSTPASDAYVETAISKRIAARGGPLPEGLKIDIARQLCDACPPARFHAAGHLPRHETVQRDADAEGRVVLIDFGISRLFRSARKGP
jgi:hypothetical protein